MKWQNQVVFPLLIINASGTFTGLFVYSPSIGAGNLIASIAAQAGTDPYGNAYLSGFTSYAATNQIAQLIAGLVKVGKTTDFGLALFSGGSGIGQLTSGLLTGTDTIADLFLLSAQAAGGTGTPVVQIPNGPLALSNVAVPATFANNPQLFGINGQLAQVYTSGQQARLSTGRLASVSAVVVTQATFTSLFNATILGGEAVAGAKYKATAYGFGAWGSTVQDLVFGIRFGATDATTIGTTPDINSASFAASALFRWKAEAELTCVTNGASATWVANITGFVTQTANSILVGTAGTNSIAFTGGTGSGTVTLDSTVNEIFGISAHWGATTGAPTLTAVSGIMERIA